MKICAYCKLGNHHLCSYRVCECPHTRAAQVKASEKYHLPKEKR